MSSFPTPPVGFTDSTLLTRVKLFLPQIAKANEALQQQISQQGPEAVQIDRALKVGLSNSSQTTAKEDDESEKEEEGEEVDSENEILMTSSRTTKHNQDLLQLENNICDREIISCLDKAQKKNKTKLKKHGDLVDNAVSDHCTIQLEFAIGDVDQTAIALAEAEDSVTETEALTSGEDSTIVGREPDVIFHQLI